MAAGVAIGVAVTLLVRAPRRDRRARQRAATVLPGELCGFLADAQGRPDTAGELAAPRSGRQPQGATADRGAAQASVLRLWALQPDAPPLALGEVPLRGEGLLVLADTSEQAAEGGGARGVGGRPARHPPRRRSPSCCAGPPPSLLVAPPRGQPGPSADPARAVGEAGR